MPIPAQSSIVSTEALTAAVLPRYALPLFRAARQIRLTEIDFAGHGGWLPQSLNPSNCGISR